MRISFKQRSLGKKVLLSVIAAGVMSGFVLNSEVLAAENQVFNDPVNMKKIEITLLVINIVIIQYKSFPFSSILIHIFHKIYSV